MPVPNFQNRTLYHGESRRAWFPVALGSSSYIAPLCNLAEASFLFLRVDLGAVARMEPCP